MNVRIKNTILILFTVAYMSAGFTGCGGTKVKYLKPEVFMQRETHLLLEKQFRFVSHIEILRECFIGLIFWLKIVLQIAFVDCSKPIYKVVIDGRTRMLFQC